MFLSHIHTQTTKGGYILISLIVVIFHNIFVYQNIMCTTNIYKFCVNYASIKLEKTKDLIKKN